MRRLRGRPGRVAFLLGLAVLVAIPGFPVGTAQAGPPAARHGPASAPVSSWRGSTPAPPGAVPLPAAAAPIFNWGLAYIYYGPGDDSTHFMGEGAAMVVDDTTRNITTFGGEGSGGLTPYTMDYNYSTGNFNVTTLNPSPSARTNASFATVPGQDYAILFGGLTNLTTDRTVNDTWVYYFRNQTWRNVTGAVAPPAREEAAFAVDPVDATGLLEGGWNPDAIIAGSPASVFWNDTWTINTTTFVWTQRHPSSAPPPLYGSGMIWQNVTGQFDLFGGCSLRCSSDTWSYGGSPAHWHKLAAIGSIPTARGSPAFVWDGTDGLGILYGGFAWGSGGAEALASGSLFTPSTSSWVPLDVGGGPGPVYDAANTWSDFPGCQGLIIAGGNGALAGPPTNASVLERFAGNFTNCFPDLISGGSSPPPPPCSVQSVPLQVRVIDNLTGRGIPNASVTYNGHCVENLHGTTDRYGELVLTLPAPDVLNFTATANGYRPNSAQTLLIPNTSAILTIPLVPFPTLTVRAVGLGLSGIPYPLENVSIQDASFSILGATNAGGWLNISPLQLPAGPTRIHGYLANYSNASVPVVLPESGPVWVNLTLDAAGALDVRIIDATTGRGIAAASGELKNVDLQGPGVVTFTTGPSGWYNFSRRIAANYSVSGTAPGYSLNLTKVDHRWIATETVVVALPPLVGGVLDVFVRDASTSLPLPGALVVLATFSNRTSDAAGWANFTDVKPPALYEVVASHPGYRSNFSFVSLDYGLTIAPYVVRLIPLPPCADAPSCTVGVVGPNTPPFGYLTGGPSIGLLILGTPAALLAAGLAYALLAGRRRARRAAPAAASQPRST